MAHISSITAVRFTELAISTMSVPAEDRRNMVADSEAALFRTAFATPAMVTSIGQVREFPNLGTPANIVNVPNYGASISSQVGGQADAPDLTFTLNYVPGERGHAQLNAIRTEGTTVSFRARLTDREDLGIITNGLPADAAVEFDDLYWTGRVVSFEIVPALNDSMQANVAVTIEGDFVGPATLMGANYTTATS